MNLLTRVAVGAAAVLATTTILATAAFAQVTTVSTAGPFKVMADPSIKTCALGIGNSAGETLIISHDGVKHSTTIAYGADKLGDLSGKTGTVTFVIDDKEYDWKAEGGNGVISITSTDTKLPPALINAEIFGAMVGDSALFAIKSDANFETAMNATLSCAHKLGSN